MASFLKYLNYSFQPIITLVYITLSKAFGFIPNKWICSSEFGLFSNPFKVIRNWFGKQTRASNRRPWVNTGPGSTRVTSRSSTVTVGPRRFSNISVSFVQSLKSNNFQEWSGMIRIIYKSNFINTSSYLFSCNSTSRDIIGIILHHVITSLITGSLPRLIRDWTRKKIHF